MAENNEKIRQMKNEYQKKIDALEMELKDATNEKDVDKAVYLIKEKEKTQQALNEVETLEKTQGEQGLETKKTVVTDKSNGIQMSPAEFESLIVNILKETQQNNVPGTTPNTGTLSVDSIRSQQQIDALNQRLDFLEKLLIEINAQKGSETQIISPIFRRTRCFIKKCSTFTGNSG